MGPNVKEGYPGKLSSKEIQEEMVQLSRYANGGGYRADLIVAANSMIQSGQAELNDRFSRKAFWITLILTVLTIIAAGISIYFGFKTDRSDSEWRNTEIELLQSIEINTSKK